MSASRSVSAGAPPGIGTGLGLVSFQTGTVTILSGTSVSNAIDCRNLGMLVAMLFPAAWTAASCGVQGSLDNITFIDIQDSSGNDVRTPYTALNTNGGWISLTNSAPPGSTTMGPVGAPYLKLRSGSVISPVNQAANRTVTLLFYK